MGVGDGDWRLEKLRVVEAYGQLAARYGLMRVCRQMLGADSTGQIKVWINPNPVLNHPWSACES